MKKFLLVFLYLSLRCSKTFIIRQNKNLFCVFLYLFVRYSKTFNSPIQKFCVFPIFMMPEFVSETIKYSDKY